MREVCQFAKASMLAQRRSSGLVFRREQVCWLGFGGGATRITTQPGGLGTSGADRRKALGLADLFADFKRLVECLPGCWVASSRADTSDHGQRVDMVDQGPLQVAFDRFCELDRLRPATSEQP